MQSVWGDDDDHCDDEDDHDNDTHTQTNTQQLAGTSVVRGCTEDLHEHINR